MPIKSNEAKQARLARKRFTRTITRLESARNQTTNKTLRAEYNQQLRTMRSALKATYAPKGGWQTAKQKQRLSDAIEKGDKISKTTKIYLGSTQRVKNFNFQQQIKWASSANKSALSTLGSNEVKFFYRVTENIWQNVPPAKRNEAIMKYFKTKDLETAFKRALSHPTVKEALDKANRRQELVDKDKAYWTEEQRAFYEDSLSSEGKQDEGSPIESFSIVPFNTDTDWKAEISGEVEK